MVDDADVTIIRKLRDLELAEVIELVENGLELDLTVICKGVLISGTVISGKEYYERLASIFESQNTPLSNYFEQVGLARYAHQTESIDPLWNFIHFADVRVHNGNESLLYSPNQPLRVKLEEIDGHFYGLLSPNSD